MLSARRLCRFHWGIMLVRADAAPAVPVPLAAAQCHSFVSYVSKLCAGAAGVPAGYSSGRGDSARGGTARGNSECGMRNSELEDGFIRPCGSIGMFGVWFAPGACVPSAMSCVRSRLALRSCCRVLRSITPVFFPLAGKKRRLAVCHVPIPAWVEIAFRAFSNAVRLSDCAGTLGDCAFLAGDSDGVTESAAQQKCVFAQSHWPCGVFRREYVGDYAPQNLRQRVFDSLDSLHLGRDVSALYEGKPCTFYAAVIIDPLARPCRRS